MTKNSTKKTFWNIIKNWLGLISIPWQILQPSSKEVTQQLNFISSRPNSMSDRQTKQMFKTKTSSFSANKSTGLVFSMCKSHLLCCCYARHTLFFPNWKTNPIQINMPFPQMPQQIRVLHFASGLSKNTLPTKLQTCWSLWVQSSNLSESSMTESRRVRVRSGTSFS